MTDHDKLREAIAMATATPNVDAMLRGLQREGLNDRKLREAMDRIINAARSTLPKVRKQWVVKWPAGTLGEWNDVLDAEKHARELRDSIVIEEREVPEVPE